MAANARAIRCFAIGDGSSPRSRIDAPLGQVLFFVALGLWMGFGILQRTWYVPIVSSFVKFADIRHVCLVLLLVHEIVYGRRDLRSLAGFAVAAGMAAIAHTWGYSSLFDMLCFVFAGRDIPFKRIAKFALVIMAAIIAFTVVTALLGITTDAIYTSDDGRRARHGLGFAHPNTGPASSVFAFFIWAFIRGKRFNWGDAAGMLAIEGFLYYFTDSRTAMVLAVVLAVFMMAVRYLPAKVLSSRILKVLLIGSVLIIAAFTLALCVLYDPSVAWMAKLDSLFSGRLHLAHNCINDFGVTVFGQKVTLGGGSNYNRYTGKWVTGSSAHILDDAYARALIQCGIVYFVAGLALCTATMRKLYAQGQLHTLAIIAVIALYAIMESCALYLSYNIFLFLFAVLIEPPSPTLDPPPPSEQHANKSKSRGDFDLLPSETTYE